MKSASRVQFLVEDVYVHLALMPLGRGIKPSLLYPVGQTGFCSIGRTTHLEEKFWEQASCLHIMVCGAHYYPCLKCPWGKPALQWTEIKGWWDEMGIYLSIENWDALYVTHNKVMGTSCVVMVCKLDQQTIVSEFDSYWLSHTASLVSQLS